MQRVEDGGKREIPSENIIQQTDKLYDAHVGFVLILTVGFWAVLVGLLLLSAHSAYFSRDWEIDS